MSEENKLEENKIEQNKLEENRSTELASKIIFIQSKNKSNSDCTFDAINNYISSLDTCKELKFIDYYYIDNKESFKITDKIYCKATKLEQNKENVNSYSLELYSYTLQLAELKKFIHTLKKNIYMNVIIN